MKSRTLRVGTKFLTFGLIAAAAWPVARSVLAPSTPAMAAPSRGRDGNRPWEQMDYGPFQCASISASIGKDHDNWANKGMAIHLGDEAHPAAVLFDTATLRYAAGWTGDFLTLNNVVFSGQHGPNPTAKGKIAFVTTNNPGWAKGGSDWTDPRSLSEPFEFPEERQQREQAGKPAKPGEKVGSLPRDWGHYKGAYLAGGNKVVLAYSIGDADVLDFPEARSSGTSSVFTRTLNVGPSKQPMAMAVTEVVDNAVQVSADGKTATLKDAPETGKNTVVAVEGDASAKLTGDKGKIVLNIPAHDAAIKVRVAIASGDNLAPTALHAAGPVADLSALTKGGKARWGNALTTAVHLGDDKAYLQSKAAKLIADAKDDVAKAQDEIRSAKNDSDRTKGRNRLQRAQRETEKRQKEATEMTSGNAAYVIDTVDVPFENPYHSWMRTSGLDFFSDGRAAVSTWSGDVWIVSFDADMKHAHWKRFATGLFQSLGLKIVNDTVYVQGRDQITILHDLNNDGEADFYENFNNDVQVTTSFHEFSLDLQTDAEGNFYFAKAGPVRPGGRGWQQISRDNGTVVKISKDGKQLETFAVGLRAPNGMGFGGPNGILSVGDNEGTWTPTDRLNFVKQGDFLGVVDLCHSEAKPTSYGNPVCWLPHNGNPDYGTIDNSNGSQAWVPDDRFGPFKDSMLYLSYGTCSLFHVSYEKLPDGKYQGGAVKFPLGFDSGAMRIRFNPKDGQPWVTGLKGWQTTAGIDGMLQRVRFTGKPINMPAEWHVNKQGVQISFLTPLDKATATNPENWSVEQWNYRWTQAYGSKEWSVKDPNKEAHDPVEIKGITLSPDGKTVMLQLSEVVPVMQMRIKMDVKSTDGQSVNTNIFTTINEVPDTKAVSQR